jgi:tripartite ATP-independent transporter DctP family solute receptor
VDEIKKQALSSCGQGAKVARRTVFSSALALPFVITAARQASAARYRYKFATGQSLTNPINIRIQQALDRIQNASNGKLHIRLFPNNELGSDTDQIGQVRSGAIQFLNVAASVLATVVPAASLVNVGFAFSDYDQVWKAVDGAVGQYINSQIQAAGIVPVTNLANNGFRQISTSTQQIRTPADLRGFKIRVPESPIFTSLFQALGAAPTSLNFNEVYTALQTHLVGGQENALTVIKTAKLYEVEKYCSLTNHIWDGFCLLANPAAFGNLPSDMQAVVRKELGGAVLAQRADEVQQDAALKPKLEQQGMTFIDVDKAAFKGVLAQSGFYGKWKAHFGSDAWSALESVTGPLG